MRLEQLDQRLSLQPAHLVHRTRPVVADPGVRVSCATMTNQQVSHA
jgi:hypothetical protein